MGIFYKDKNYREHYDRARHNGASRADARSKAEMFTLAYYGAIVFAIFVLLILSYLAVLFINSPGIATVELISSIFGLELGKSAAWLSSCGISFFVYFLVWGLLRKYKREVVIFAYATVCLVCAAGLFKMTNNEGRSFAEEVSYRYSPHDRVSGMLPLIFGNAPKGGSAASFEEDIEIRPVDVVVPTYSEKMLGHTQNPAEEFNNDPGTNASKVSASTPQVDGEDVQATQKNGFTSSSVVSSDEVRQNVGDGNVSEQPSVENKDELSTKLTQQKASSLPRSENTGFDCQFPVHAYAKIICGDFDLITADNLILRKIDAAIKAKSLTNPEIVHHMKWILKVKDCRDTACVRDLYSTRLSELDIAH